ncbi:hypothetical protein CDG76_29610 [Nostoc sp. 'Peltigera membranacea cyanobiont' 210A]|nr:hypothetical protein CDG76_29610 [Nostoc sp. 'Peltigera membranacea cyanobiont' 210A]
MLQNKHLMKMLKLHKMQDKARDAMNRRFDKRLIIVETAIYRVFKKFKRNCFQNTTYDFRVLK